MAKTLHYIFALLTLLPMVASGQTYTQMWRQANEAKAKDLPQTQVKHLMAIIDKAEADGDHGQLLKAGMAVVKVATGIAPDSLTTAVEYITRRMERTTDTALRAVYAASLCRIYRDNPGLATNAEAMADSMRRMAMAHPQELAKAKAGAFAPFVVNGYDSRVFGDDLLSVIAYEVEDFKTAYDHYLRAGNRAATCMSALGMIKQHRAQNAERINKSDYIMWLDSLINVYADLDVTAEAAIERYNYMEEYTDATVEQRISYIHYALDRWGSWHNIGQLRNAERNLTAPCFAMSMESRVALPGVPLKVELTQLRNISSLTMRLYRANVDATTTHDPMTNEGFRKMQPLLTLLKDQGQTRRYMSHPDYQYFEDSLTIGPLQPGVYVIELRTSPSTEVVRSLLYVTNLRLLALPLPAGRTRYVALNATTGQPVPRATISIAKWTRGRKRQTVATLTCDDNGEATHRYDQATQGTVFATVSTATDRYCPGRSMYGGFSYATSRNTQTHIQAYTDRRIYRPGQTVHMAAVAYQYDANGQGHALAGKTFKATLRDANSQVVAERDITTDDYGTCSALFALPTRCATGRYSLKVGNNSWSYFSVEQYKRPTFQVEVPQVNERYAAGDTLLVTARAATFAGAPVQGAHYSYTVRRQRAMWWRPWNANHADADQTVYSGQGTTGADGTMAIEMPMVMPTMPAGAPGFYNFIATIDVTDAAGETRTGQISVPLGTKPTAFSCDLPQQALADSLNAITFTLRNASGQAIGASVRCQIDNQGPWLQGQTDKPIALGHTLASGPHTLTAICESDTLQAQFTVFALSDTTPATTTHNWFYAQSNHFPTDGSTVTVQVGSSDSLVHILYSIIAGDSILESGAIDLSNALHNRQFAYRSEYGDGVLLNYAWVKDGKCYEHSHTIRRPLPGTQLQMAWHTFRDRLTPGQQEQWTLRIATPDGQPAPAQLMATLYDKALDEIAAHTWRPLTYGPWLSLPATSWRSQRWGGIYGGGMQQWTAQAYRPFEVSHFDNDVMPSAISQLSYSAFGRQRMLMRSARTDGATKSMAMANALMVEEAATADMAASAKATYDTHAIEAEAEANGGSAMQMRENLQETAFFYPALQADSTGVVAMSFTLPESLTTWRFMGMAHTKDMLWGITEAQAVASKDVMVVPNVPRFVRSGDHATIATRIVNTAGRHIGGTAQLELIDPATDKTLTIKKEPFYVQADSTIGIAFAIEAPSDMSLLICRVSASGDTFADGEQHYLPILPCRERVTVTEPFMLNGPSTASIQLQSMLPASASQPKLTIEYTNNPAWLVVQALPTMAQPRSENAIDQCAAYYAAAMAQHIAGSSPAIKRAVEQWQMETGGEPSLMSNLGKNGELLDLVLSETPWVADAEREQEQRQMLTMLLDNNQMNSHREQAAARLAALQQEDGSWSWYPGMPGNMQITVEVAEMMVRANGLVGHQTAPDQMLSRAFGFMEQHIVAQVDRLRQAERGGTKPSFPGTTTLRYLYICALDGRRQSAKVQQANNYLIALLQKSIAQQSIYEKALTAVVLDKQGLADKSREYVQSLKEYTVYTDQMGRYYDTPRATYSWRDHRLPTQVAAIEAMQRITPADSATTSQMRLWLLRQKQTQAWDTPINSVNAIHAFMMNGAEVLAAQPMATLSIDSKPLELPQATAAMGYVKTSIQQPWGSSFTAAKTTQGTSWGAVYAQGMVPLADITASGQDISVTRELIAPQGTLRVGDRVTVRITILANRDLDFVEVVDRRAACMEPVEQTSGCRGGAYCSPKDNATTYCFDRMSKGKHVIETQYYIDRTGQYMSGTCTAACAYAPEYRATDKPLGVVVE